MSLTVHSPGEVCAAVRELPEGTRLLPVGAGTKPGLSSTALADVELLDVTGLRGVVDYDPAELTMTALPGTPVAELASVLAEHGQYLPFDPPLVGAGATVGGVVAAGVSGPGALRYGGVRDFVIGVHFVDGTAREVSGGGRVVKNAAGFDFSKLMTGSIGSLGVITQVSLKVFPRPAATLTVDLELETVERALAAVCALARGPLDLDALEIAPGGRLLARLGGPAETLDARAQRLAALVDAPSVRHEGEAEERLWRAAAELGWAPEGSAVIRVGLSARRVLELDAALASTPDVLARYSIAGTTAWIAWPAGCPIDDLDSILDRLELPGLVLTGVGDRRVLGPRSGGEFGVRVRRAIDPRSRFLEV